jgi:3-methyladenine DNA glycosylase Mpg
VVPVAFWKTSRAFISYPRGPSYVYACDGHSGCHIHICTVDPSVPWGALIQACRIRFLPSGRDEGMELNIGEGVHETGLRTRRRKRVPGSTSRRPGPKLVDVVVANKTGR